MRGLNLAMRVNFLQNANLTKSNLASNGLSSTQNGINWADCFTNLAKFLAPIQKAKRTTNAK